MLTINQDLLTNMGINLGDQTPAFLEHISSELSERIGTALIDALDDEQAQELVSLSESTDDTTIQTWLAQNLPEYKDIIQDEYDILLGEIAKEQSL